MSQPLRRAVTSTVSSAGAVRFDFETVPSGLVYSGVAYVPGAPVSTVWQAFESGDTSFVIGSWLGIAGGFVQIPARGQLVVTATGLTAGLSLTCWLVGVAETDGEQAPFYPSNYLT